MKRNLIILNIFLFGVCAAIIFSFLQTETERPSAYFSERIDNRIELELASAEFDSIRQGSAEASEKSTLIEVDAEESMNDPDDIDVEKIAPDKPIEYAWFKKLNDKQVDRVFFFIGGYLVFDAAILDVRTATKIAKRARYNLTLGGIDRLEPGVAKILGDFDGSTLSILDIRFLSTEDAREIARFRGSNLSVAGMSLSNVEVAIAISKFRGSSLALSGLSKLDVASARAIAAFQGDYLSLTDVDRSNAKVMRALRRYKGELSFLKSSN